MEATLRSPSLSSASLLLHRFLSPCPSNLNCRVGFSVSAEHRRRSIGTHPGVLRIRSKAGSSGNVESVGVPTSVPVRVAHELLLAGHRYLDVRTPEEFSAGHPSGATNIPYMYKVGSGMSKNPNFVEQVSSQFSKHDEIIVGCQGGKRSIKAASDLVAAGFTGITDVAGGYVAWTENGLPTEK